MESNTPIRDLIESGWRPDDKYILSPCITEEEKAMLQAILDEEMPSKRIITVRDPEAWGIFS